MGEKNNEIYKFIKINIKKVTQNDHFHEKMTLE